MIGILQNIRVFYENIMVKNIESELNEFISFFTKKNARHPVKIHVKKTKSE